MKDINITIKDVTPLLCHRFTDRAQMAASAGVRSAIHNNATSPQDLAEESLYKDEQGNPGLPGENLRQCLLAAGKYIKIGQERMSDKRMNLLPASFHVSPVFLRIKSNSGWKVDTRPVRIPATDGRILRHRACFDDWALAFSVGLDEDIITEKTFRELVDIAGTRIGLGDFRPDTKGPFGRFVVTEWRSDSDRLD